MSAPVVPIGRGAPERLGGAVRRARHRQLVLTILAVPLVMLFVVAVLTAATGHTGELVVLIGAAVAFFAAPWLGRR